MSDTYGVVVNANKPKKRGRPRRVVTEDQFKTVTAFLKGRSATEKGQLKTGTQLNNGVLDFILKDLEKNGKLIKSGTRRTTKYTLV